MTVQKYILWEWSLLSDTERKENGAVSLNAF